MQKNKNTRHRDRSTFCPGTATVNHRRSEEISCCRKPTRLSAVIFHARQATKILTAVHANKKFFRFFSFKIMTKLSETEHISEKTAANDFFSKISARFNVFAEIGI